jgi:hypothetical protein
LSLAIGYTFRRSHLAQSTGWPIINNNAAAPRRRDQAGFDYGALAPTLPIRWPTVAAREEAHYQGQPAICKKRSASHPVLSKLNLLVTERRVS